jgi:hypothetical protein
VHFGPGDVQCPADLELEDISEFEVVAAFVGGLCVRVLTCLHGLGGLGRKFCGLIAWAVVFEPAL